MITKCGIGLFRPWSGVRACLEFGGFPVGTHVSENPVSGEVDRLSAPIKAGLPRLWTVEGDFLLFPDTKETELENGRYGMISSHFVQSELD